MAPCSVPNANVLEAKWYSYRRSLRMTSSVRRRQDTRESSTSMKHVACFGVIHDVQRPQHPALLFRDSPPQMAHALPTPFTPYAPSPASRSSHLPMSPPSAATTGLAPSSCSGSAGRSCTRRLWGGLYVSTPSIEIRSASSSSCPRATLLKPSKSRQRQSN